MYYINFKYDGEVETCDEFEDKKEAYKMLAEYQMVSGGYYLSQRCTNDWRER